MKSQLCSVLALFVCAGSMASAQTTPQQRMQACAREWDGLKAANQTTGRTYRDFEKECLARQGRGSTPKTVGVAPRQETPARPRTGEVAPGGSSTVAEAQRQCPSDAVVWVNTSTKVYHVSGSRLFGNTKHGSYMCRGEGERAGFRAAKNDRASSSR
jgi:hypothetical protein